MLGILWALACLWLGYLGSHWVVPGVLVTGFLALWGWRHVEWLWWFPAVLVAATMLEPFSPLSLRSRFGPLVYIDLLTIGVVVVALVRAIGLKLPLIPRTPVDGFVLAMSALFAVTLVWPGAEPRTFADFKQPVVCGVVFYATATVASRPLGSRWVWVAFPLASTLIGGHALWAFLQGPDILAHQTHVADRVWGTHAGVLALLMVALPVSVGLALSAGSGFARLTWTMASVAGAAGLALHLSVAGVLSETPGWGTRWTPVGLVRALIACTALLIVASVAWKVRQGRMHEGPRWLAVTLAFTVRGLLELGAPEFSGPSAVLLAVGSGLVAGTLRADRRAMRSGRRIGPPLAEAA
jgi:hypothetical protein